MKRARKLVSLLLTLVIVLGLLPPAALAAKLLVPVESVVITSDKTKPVLGQKTALKTSDITVQFPADERIRVVPDSDRRYWKYSANGKTDWIKYTESDNVSFTPGYWQCFFSLWTDNSDPTSRDYIDFADPCVVTVNGVEWSSSVIRGTGGSMLYVKSPVFVLDSAGDVLTEVSAISASSNQFPELFTAGQEPASLSSFSFTINTAVAVLLDKSAGVWQVKEGDTWRDMASGETCVAGSQYRLKATLKLTERNAQLITLARDVSLTVDGVPWTVDHDTMQNAGTKISSVTVYSHEIYAASPTIQITFYDSNKPSEEALLTTIEVPGGEYTLPECTFPPASDELLFSHWDCEDVNGNDVEKQPGETILLLEDADIYLYWKWKPYVSTATFDVEVSHSYTPGIKAGDFASLSLEDGQHISLVGSGYGEAYWIECGDEILTPDTKLSTLGRYAVVVNFRLEEGYLNGLQGENIKLKSDVLGEVTGRTPAEQDDGSYIVRFYLPLVPGTPISADKVTFTLDGYEVDKTVSAITPGISTEDVFLKGSGYGNAGDGCACLIYEDSKEAYVYYQPIYGTTAVFEASKNYYLEFYFTLTDGCSLPASFWDGEELVKEKFELSGIEGAEIMRAEKWPDGFCVRFQLPQLGNVPIGAVRLTVDGYEAGTTAQDVVITGSDNVSPSPLTPQEQYLNQYYYFYDPDNVHIEGLEDYQLPENMVSHAAVLQDGDEYNLAFRLYPAKGYDASEMIPSDVVISTVWGDRQAEVVSEEMYWYWVICKMPKIGQTNPSYAVTMDPGEGIGEAYHIVGNYAGSSYTLPQINNVAFEPPEGMCFSGWSVGGVKKQPGDQITITGYTVVTALWEPEILVTEVEIRLEMPKAGDALDKTATGVHRGTTAESAPYQITTVSWQNVTRSTAMNDGDMFVAGDTYRYRVLVKIKSGGTETFPDSAEEIAVTLKDFGGAYTMEKKRNGAYLVCDVFFDCSSLSGTVTKSGSTAKANVAVGEFSGSEALLIVAQYSGGKMLSARTATVTSAGTYQPAAFSYAPGSTYRAFLLNAKSYLPLCVPVQLLE